MFGLFGNSEEKKLEKQYRKLLEEARDIQRKGDMKAFALKTAEAEEVGRKLEALRSKK